MDSESGRILTGDAIEYPVFVGSGGENDVANALAECFPGCAVVHQEVFELLDELFPSRLVPTRYAGIQPPLKRSGLRAAKSPDPGWEAARGAGGRDSQGDSFARPGGGPRVAAARVAGANVSWEQRTDATFRWADGQDVGASSAQTVLWRQSGWDSAAV